MKKIVFLIINLIVLSAYSQLVTSIPFTVEDNHIYISVKVNEADSLKFLFDTGANGSVVNEKYLKKPKLKFDGVSLNIGSNGTNEVKSSSGNEVKMGNIITKNVTLTLISFGTDKLDGIIGTNLMEEHIIEIDYHKNVLNFYNEEVNYEGYEKVKLYSDDFYPTFIKSKIITNEKEYVGFFGLDTGADDALTLASPFVKKNDFHTKLDKIGIANSQGSDGSTYEKTIVNLPEIEFATKHLYSIPTGLSNATEGGNAIEELAGFFGNSFLKKFNIILDYKNEYIYFKLNNNLYSEL